jgi:hypothetical protein
VLVSVEGELTVRNLPGVIEELDGGALVDTQHVARVVGLVSGQFDDADVELGNVKAAGHACEYSGF